MRLGQLQEGALSDSRGQLSWHCANVLGALMKDGLRTRVLFALVVVSGDDRTVRAPLRWQLARDYEVKNE